MAVNLSPLGGVGAQFFDNSGNPLTGGKIYTYAAGTTTPQTTFTSSAGNTAHSNPIILDAAGRVPGGEIWLTDGSQYKFVLKTSTDMSIATYDNIVGINSNFVNYTNQQEIQTATAGQTVFTLTSMQYQPGTGALSVFVDGVNQYGPGAQYAYTETDSTTVTFNSGLHVGAEVKFTTAAINAASYGNAFQISYTPPFTGSVATNLGDKSAQWVSVKDFGAVGDGVVDDTAAIQAAIDTGNSLYFPPGNYIISSTLTFYTGANNGQRLMGAGPRSLPSVVSGPDSNKTIITPTAAVSVAFDVDGTPNSLYIQYGKFIDLTLDMVNMTDATTSIGFRQAKAWGYTYDNVRVINDGNDKRGFKFETGAYTTHLQECTSAVLELAGTSFAAGVTTITGMNLDLQQVYARYATQCAFYMPVLQGTRDKFDLENIIDFSIMNGDIEGDGVYLKIGSNVTGLRSFGNGFLGFSAYPTGTYITGTLGIGSFLEDFISDTSSASINPGTNGNWIVSNSIIEPVNKTGVLYQNCGPFDTGFKTDLQYPVNGLYRARIRNPNTGASGSCDLNVSVDTRDLYLGINKTASRSYLDNRGFQDFEFQESGAGVFRYGYTNISVYPSDNNYIKLGRAGNRWSEVFAVNGTINTSDARQKQQVRELSDAEKAVAVRLKQLIRAYKFNDAVNKKSDEARIHIGVMAQEVQDAFTAEGLDAHKYGVFCYDKWDAEIDASGNVQKEAGDSYGVRYDQLWAFIIAAM